jgi:hypothetical protein
MALPSSNLLAAFAREQVREQAREGDAARPARHGHDGLEQSRCNRLSHGWMRSGGSVAASEIVHRVVTVVGESEHLAGGAAGRCERDVGRGEPDGESAFCGTVATERMGGRAMPLCRSGPRAQHWVVPAAAGWRRWLVCGRANRATRRARSAGLPGPDRLLREARACVGARSLQLPPAPTVESCLGS